MSALSSDRATDYRDGVEIDAPVAASAKLYGGSLACFSAGGYLVPAADTAGLTKGGVVMAQTDNSAGSNGDVKAVIRRKGVFRFKGSSLTQALVGQAMCAVDDQTIAPASATTNDVVVGTLVGYISATEGWLEIG